MSNPDSVRTLLAEAHRRLGALDAAALDAELLLAHALGVTRTRLYADPEAAVAEDAARRYRELIAARAEGRPVAYLVGRREFWSLEFEVSPDTLIPRPETEFLVEVALELLHGRHRPRVADLGTGTSAIAAALASERPDARVLATDASAEALAVAARNVERLGLANVALRRADWFEGLEGERFDLIVSNPPYVRADFPGLSWSDIRHEPRAALVAGEDGLDALRRIIGCADQYLAPGGHLAVEHGAEQGEAVRALMHAAGLALIVTRRDLAGHERLTVGAAVTRRPER